MKFLRTLLVYASRSQSDLLVFAAINRNEGVGGAR